MQRCWSWISLSRGYGLPKACRGAFAGHPADRRQSVKGSVLIRNRDSVALFGGCMRLAWRRGRRTQHGRVSEQIMHMHDLSVASPSVSALTNHIPTHRQTVQSTSSCRLRGGVSRALKNRGIKLLGVLRQNSSGKIVLSVLSTFAAKACPQLLARCQTPHRFHQVLDLVDEDPTCPPMHVESILPVSALPNLSTA